MATKIHSTKAVHTQSVATVTTGATYTVDLPAGLYELALVGTYTSTSTTGVITLGLLTDSAQTEVLNALLAKPSTAAAGAITSTNDTAGIYAKVVMGIGTEQSGPIYVPHGISVTVIEGSFTALDLNLHAVEV